ncbi:timeless protein, partial [Ancylostoma duodenale]
LLANLTQPAIVSLQGKQPEDRDEWQTFWVLEENLRRAKLAFADVKFFTVLKEKLEKYFLETDWEDRLEEDRLVMERIIVLIRYIFSISPTDRDGKRTTTESNSHDRVISAFLESGIDQVFSSLFYCRVQETISIIFQVLIHIASQSKERDFHLSVLVIFALIVKEHNAEDIVVAGRDRTTAEKEKAEEELREIVENEQSRMNAQRRKILASRHSRFAGSYVVKGLSAVNKEKDLVVVKPIKDVNDLTFLDERKAKKRIAKNRRPFEAQERTHLSSMELRIKLKKFVEDVLSKCFNRLMKSTKELAFDTRLSAGQRNADLHFFLLMTFMLKYTRLAKSASSDVSGCLHVEAFHHVQVHISNFLESAATMRKEAKYYGIRAQYALSAYKELILFHQYLLDNGSPEEKELSHRTCDHILVVEEYREMGLMLMRRFMPGVLSKTFLRDLVLSTHYYFRLLEKSVKSGDLTTVKKRSKVRRRTRRSTKEAEGFGPEPLPAVVDSLSGEDLERKWSLINEELNEVILGNKEASTDQIPINSLLDVEEELHQKFAMLKVQRAMREGRPADAMGLYRSSRAVWLSDGYFFGFQIADQLLSAELAAQKKFEANSMIDDAGEEDLCSDEDEEEEPKYETKEVYFICMNGLWYVFLLNDFATNSAELNKALVKLLHRVAFDLKMPSRLFQLSLFRIFAQVRTHFEGVKKEDMKKNRFFELYTFGYHLLKKSIMDRNFPIIQMKQLMEEYNSKEEEEDEDIVNFIKTRLAETHGEFSRQKIIKQMNYLGVVYERKKTSSKKYKEWNDGLRTELAALKQQYEEMDAEDHELSELRD